MSQENEKPESPTKQKASRGFQETAPGVFSYKNAPSEQATSLSTGDLIGGRFKVERYLGASGGGVSYLSLDTKTSKPAVIKVLTMPYPGEEKVKAMSDFIRKASGVRHPNLTRLLGMGLTEGNEIFVALEFIRGATVANILRKKREAGGKANLYEMFTILAHVCDSLSLIHDAGMTHGVLTPYNVYLDTGGKVRVGNFGFGSMAAEYQFSIQRGPYIDSIYVAPEVPEAPELMSSAADIYSLGMLAAEMLSPDGLPDDRDEAKAEAIMMLSKYPAALSKLIAQSLGEDLAARPKHAKSFRDSLYRAVGEAGTDVHAPPPKGSLPIEPAVEQSEVHIEENLFDIPELSSLGIGKNDASDERYLVQKKGLDYGPFDKAQILDQLYKDEINEYTLVLDRITTERIELAKIDVFKKEVKVYIPKREARLKKEAAQRAKLERQVKQAGKGTLIVAIFAMFLIGGAQLFYVLTRPEPMALPMQNAFAEMNYNFLPPPKEFTAVAVDSDVLKNLFNPKASDADIARVLKKSRKKGQKLRSKGNPKKGNRKAEEDDENPNVVEVDMSAGNGSEHILDDVEINNIILSKFGGLRSCVMKELKVNRKFTGATIKFFIRPSGTVGGVKVRGKYKGSTVGGCLKSKFRRMKFPEHGGFNRGVTYPLPGVTY